MIRTVRSGWVIAGLFVALLALFPYSAAADTRTPAVVERAAFVVGNQETPPGDYAAWQPVALPDDWRRLGSGFRGNAWYRIAFDVAAVPERPLAVYLRHPRSRQVAFFVNGHLLGGTQDLHGRRVQSTGFPVLLTIPPALLREGENTLHARMTGSAAMNPPAGLGHLVLGDTLALREIARHENNLTSGAIQSFSAAMLTAGLIALLLWFAQRSDKVMLWFSIACLSWAAARYLTTHLQWSGLPDAVLQVARQYVNFGLPVPAVLLCLRTVGLRWPQVETALWAHLALATTFTLWLPAAHLEWAWSYLRAAGPLLCVAGGLIVYAAAPRPLRWSFLAEIAAMLAMAVAFSFDLARDLNWIALDSHNVRPYHVPALLLAFGAAIFERHVGAFWRIARSNEELERRVTAKTREIEANHQKVADAEREHALALERQRILADMHDGLGASLVALLRLVQSGRGERAIVEPLVQRALQEMRISIDALQPRAGDLAAVLGDLRYQLDDTIRATGLTLGWEVADLGPVEGLKPTTVFSLQRIVYEAITNAIKHSAARHLRVTARPLNDAEIEISVEDDGIGFDPTRSHAGLGLASMRARRRAGRSGRRRFLAGTGNRRATVAAACGCGAGARTAGSRRRSRAGRRPCRERCRATGPHRMRSGPDPGPFRSSPSSAARVTAAAPECTVSLR